MATRQPTYLPGAYPQLESSENLRGYFVDEFRRIAEAIRVAQLTLDTTREKLAANRTYYVRTDGLDTHDGLENSAGRAFLTIQHGLDVLRTLDFNGFTVTVQVAAGTYSEAVSLSTPCLGGVPVLVGDTTTPSNVVISATGNTVTVSNEAILTIGGFKLTSSAGSGLFVDNAAVNVTGKMEYGAAAGAKIFANNGGHITISADYTFSGTSGYGWLASVDASIYNSAAVTATFSATPAIAYVAFSQIRSLIFLNSVTFSGSATGTRFYVQEGAMITTGGRGVNIIPGSTAGVIISGGLYT